MGELVIIEQNKAKGSEFASYFYFIIGSPGVIFRRGVENFMRRKWFYYCCVFLPLLLIDGIILGVMQHNYREEQKIIMENIADTVVAEFGNIFEEAEAITNNLYIDREINEFLSHPYVSATEFYDASRQMASRRFYEILMGRSGENIVMCSENDTIVNGGRFYRLSSVQEESWYKKLVDSESNLVVDFYYIGETNPSASAKRRVSLVRRLNYYKDLPEEKLVRVDLSYSMLVRKLQNMNFNMPVYLCSGEKILLSNEGHSGVHMDFEYLSGKEEIGCERIASFYGDELRILVLKMKNQFWVRVWRSLPMIIILALVNVFLPIEAVKRVYKHQLERHEMTLARQNAELKALHSQIDPHFLFNVLESIRMHCILKNETETAGMIESLAILERQNVNWSKDFIELKEEISFIEAYLELQKYRFGDRLSYKVEVDEKCLQYNIPKLTLVTFVENSCIHGVERKSVPCWVGVSVYEKEDSLYLEIEDTGIGMEEAEAEKLLKEMRQGTMETLMSGEHVGVLNACLRLRMMTEEQAEFHLESEPEVGTFTVIQIPVKYL